MKKSNKLSTNKNIDYLQTIHKLDPEQTLIIAINFDGTIVEDNYPNIGNLKEDADIVIRRLKSHGHTIIINSNREEQQKKEAIQFLTIYNIPFDYFNENDQQLIDHYQNDSRKIGADIYIDNKSLFYTEQSWASMFYQIIKVAKRKGNKYG